jgi:hypothetical protein
MRPKNNLPFFLNQIIFKKKPDLLPFLIGPQALALILNKRDVEIHQVDKLSDAIVYFNLADFL